ncbi:Cytochrome c oxidase subunit 3 [Rubripirellula obstinata]|uniref:Cytochrome c oxidase subunit 3 n=1 Tax=Rubripirellula obstinata TaxID=406547 RepID=A0A5B1CLV1_9BACT|nr:cytochrome c oxidase subunit 3 [Rubripirellula obstinata]KAA1261261.1 Cytochrome c oxidase subunit 3 [Rubripirellula obstinata]
MSTAQADPVSDDASHGEHGHDHDHPAFLAHHFDTPEQQFDSGKLGIWLFLVTEVLFFSGMFVAYAIFRNLRPDVFVGSSEFLNTKLGAINTGVLLFSSLTMAWAVRCSQTGEHKKLTGMLAATLSCSMVFLGVKAIEYSHKWGMGLLPAGTFFYDPANPHPTTDQLETLGFTSGTAFFLHNSLYFLCAPFLIVLLGVVAWLILSIVKGNKFQTACAMPLTIVCLSFFGGVGLGVILESGSEEGHGAAHDVAGHHGEGVAHSDAVPSVIDDGKVAAPALNDDASETSVLERLATDSTNTGLMSDVAARQAQASVASGAVVRGDDTNFEGGISEASANVLTQRQAGKFFSIYYCMTGVHAIHILGGIAVLVWLLIRSVRQDFNSRYFGPVDYVGLYWHLVDLIWIYLFPLLYLIR